MVEDLFGGGAPGGVDCKLCVEDSQREAGFVGDVH